MLQDMTLVKERIQTYHRYLRRHQTRYPVYPDGERQPRHKRHWTNR